MLFPVVISLFLVAVGCSETRRVLVETFSGEYDTSGELPLPPPIFDGKDSEKQRIQIELTRVAGNLHRPTDIQFDPSRPELMIVLEQTGAMKWFDLAERKAGTLKTYNVLAVSEQGLLGMTFHPGFPEQPLVYLNMTVRSEGRDVSRILEVRFEQPADLRFSKVAEERVLFEVEQPYQNHNAGQLAFGPDDYLYIGWGDGGWAGDPHNHGQDRQTMLGSMLRISVSPSATHPYSIPTDNPFVGDSSSLPETWAYGLRNPWRYCFDPSGRLIVADVGQNAWEELNIVRKGENLGWRFREGTHCYDPEVDCPKEGMVDPFYEYNHEEGQSITGGYVYSADDFPELDGLYVFGDFVSGRIWAMEIPDHENPRLTPFALGRWQMLISTFGLDPDGKVYVAEFGNGVIYRIDRPGQVAR